MLKMKSERAALEHLSVAASITMHARKQREIWINIEREMQREHPVPRSKRQWNVFTVSAVAVATVAIAGGAILAVASHATGLRTAAVSKVASNQTTEPAITATFQSPTSVQGIAISGDSPAEPWYFPTNAGSVTHKVYTWLQSAAVTTVNLPASDSTGVSNGYMGPARLSFTNQDGHRITVFPAYYLKRVDQHAAGYSPAYFQDVVAYEDGQHTTYLKSSELYAWLKNDQWHTEFTSESFSDDEKKAIQAVLKSRWGGLFQGLFPPEPGVAACGIPHGGPLPNGKMTPLPGTCTTQAQPEGTNVRVQFSETWNNGEAQHTWTFVVSARGEILSHTETGDTAPQLWA